MSGDWPVDTLTRANGGDGPTNQSPTIRRVCPLPAARQRRRRLGVRILSAHISPVAERRKLKPSLFHQHGGGETRPFCNQARLLLLGTRQKRKRVLNLLLLFFDNLRWKKKRKKQQLELCSKKCKWPSQLWRPSDLV